MKSREIIHHHHLFGIQKKANPLETKVNGGTMSLARKFYINLREEVEVGVEKMRKLSQVERDEEKFLGLVGNSLILMVMFSYNLYGYTHLSCSIS